MGPGLEVHRTKVEQVPDFIIPSLLLQSFICAHQSLPVASAGVSEGCCLGCRQDCPSSFFNAELVSAGLSVNHIIAYYGAANQRTLCILCRLNSTCRLLKTAVDDMTSYVVEVSVAALAAGPDGGS